MSLKSGSSVTSVKQMFGTTALALLLSVGLSACSTSTDEMLDAANPVNWFEDDETVPGSDEEYPNLGTVPDRPVEPEIKREYEELKSGLVADIAQAQYSDQELRSQAVPDSNLSLLQAKQIPDPELPTEPPVAAAVAEASPEVSPAPVVAAPAAAPAAVAPTPAPAAEPLAAPASEPLVSQQAQVPPSSAAGLASAPANATSPAPSPNVMPSQNVTTSSAAPAAAPVPAALTPKMIATIYFADGSASLTNTDKSVIAQVVEIYKQGGKAIFVTGHSSSPANAADQVQAGMINFRMSLNRAKAVADAFHSYGIPKSKISVEARGSKNPRYIESNEAGVAGNRRAEIYIGY